MASTSPYKAPLKDIQFLLWEKMRIQDKFPPAHPTINRESIDQLFIDASAFAEDVLGASYQRADAEECWMDENGKVHVPSDFPRLLTLFDEQWGDAFNPAEDDDEEIPQLVRYLLLELFMGANPAFMPYIGFNAPAISLLHTYGSAEQIEQCAEKLADHTWGSCLCTTEQAAGSDLSRITMEATLQDDGRYLLEGGKNFISAGMHDLTESIVYFVLARCQNAPQGMGGLSCFVVHRYEQDEQGNATIDNHVKCEEVVTKMGLRGLSNTHLSFGRTGKCYGTLLGYKENIGLGQLLLKMMTPARVSTGIYALGMASSAHLNAVEYAQNRIQGKRFDKSMSAKAPSLPIIEHPDVKRMLLQMKAVTEGCRSVISTLGAMQDVKQQQDIISKEKNIRTSSNESFMIEILAPIVKAYCSDQAWRVAETAIQVHGGNGYLRKYPVEQYARDCKVLSIWEGTNHIQAQFLLRDKFGMGVTSTNYVKAFDFYIQGALEKFEAYDFLKKETQLLAMAYQQLKDGLATIGQKVREGAMLAVPSSANLILEMTSEIIIAWQLLESAVCAHEARSKPESCSQEPSFYEDKIQSARFYSNTVLPLTANKNGVLEYLADSLSSEGTVSAA